MLLDWLSSGKMEFYIYFSFLSLIGNTLWFVVLKKPSAGGSSKTLMIVNVCPNALNLSETLLSLNFASRARNAVLSLGNRDTIKKWRDTVSSSLYVSYSSFSLCAWVIAVTSKLNAVNGIKILIYT